MNVAYCWLGKIWDYWKFGSLEVGEREVGFWNTDFIGNCTDNKNIILKKYETVEMSIVGIF